MAGGGSGSRHFTARRLQFGGTTLFDNTPNPKLFDDLREFALLEKTSCDLEPWAMLLRAMRLHQDYETSLWWVKLYNAFDSISSAWGMYKMFPRPMAWNVASIDDKLKIKQFYHTQERRNLRGGRSIIHFESYCSNVKNDQNAWLSSGLVGRKPVRLDESVLITDEMNWVPMMKHCEQIWGVGRLSSFEWVEFLGKVCDYPVHAPDAQLWLSSGPRQSITRLFGLDEETVTSDLLHDRAVILKEWLASQGVPLVWEDFETVICDFNVMRKGRYYPGRHLAALKGEIGEISTMLGLADDRDMIWDLFMATFPASWAANVTEGIDKAMMPVYRDTGKIVVPNGCV